MQDENTSRKRAVAAARIAHAAWSGGPHGAAAATAIAAEWQACFAGACGSYMESA